ncbi:MAG: translation elongation factor Ts [Thermodesulfobacteriota bacterium]|nr:translation elongation factor Ts [Thermodesulfobacteriota bacterium]
MGAISASMVKELREKSSAGMMDCKEALSACDGDIEKAMDYLRKKGLSKAAKRSGRETSEGVIESYIHMGGKIGVMVEVNCESDFVAKNDDFKAFARNIAMHIAASSPAGIEPEDVPEDVVERERALYREQVLEMGKPENMVDKIVEGKIKKFYKEACLMDQAYVKDPGISVRDYLNETVAKIGESIRIKRFARYQLGE